MRFLDIVEECGSRVGHATNNKLIRSMGLTCWITKETDTHAEYMIRIPFYKATVVMRTRVSDTSIPTLLLLHKDLGIFEL